MRVASARGDIEEGEVIGGRYRVTGLLGQGGFGTVYDAVHTTTGHSVAVKVLSERTASEADELHRRFFQEAATTSRLSHPNTVRVFDFGETDGGFLFLAMERLDGETLQDVLAANVRAGRAMPDVEAANIGIAVLRSLSEAHAHGLVHRDMKPANIFLHEVAGGDRIVKVLDFGIVKDVDASMTQAGKALGTPTHMSPEQAMGTPVDARCDLYALGVVLYECVTGTLPFMADNPLAIVMQHVTEPLEPIDKRFPGRVRPQIAAAIEKALEKMPDARWADAHEMRAGLQRAMDQQPSGAFETLGAHADKEEFKSTQQSALTPRTVRWQVGGVGHPVADSRDSRRQRKNTEPRGQSGEPSSIRVNIPGVKPVAVHTGQHREYAYSDEDATAYGHPAMLDEVPAPARAEDPPERPTHLDFDVDAATQVLDTNELEKMGYGARQAANNAPPPLPDVEPAPDLEPESRPTAPPPPKPRAEPPPKPRAEPPPKPRAKPPPAPEPPAELRAKPRPARAERSAVKQPRAAMDSAVVTVAAEAEHDDRPVSASPLDRIDAIENAPGSLGGFARRRRSGGGPPGMADLAKMMQSAGMVRGMGASSMFTPGDVVGARFSADLQRMAAQLHDRGAGRPTASASASVAAMWIGQDATTAVYGNSAGEVRLVHLDDVTEQPITLSMGRDDIEVGKHSGMVGAVAATTDGRHVVSATVSGDVRCWTPADGECVGELRVDSRATALAISTDGRVCIIGTESGQAYIAKLPDLQLKRTLSGHRGGVTAVDAASSRRLVVTGGEDGIVRTWDPVGGGSRLTKRLHDGAVGAVAISRDRSLLATGGWDGRLIVCSAREGEVVHNIEAHTDVVSGVAFDGDGEHIATVGDDGQARVWRLSSGAVMAERGDFASAPKFVRFASDDGCVYVGAWDGTVRRLAILPLF